MGYSKTELENLQPNDKVQWPHLDSVKGVYMRLTRTDRSWYFRGTLRQGVVAEPIVMVLGGVGEARWNIKTLEKEAIRLRELCEKGIDPRIPEPMPEPPAPPPLKLTMDKLWIEFQDQHHPHVSDAYAQQNKDRWRLHLHKLGSMAVADFGPEERKAFFKEFTDRKTLSNALHAQLSVMFTYAMKNYPDEVTRNTMANVNKFKLPSRKLFLSEAQLKSFAEAWTECQWESKYAVMWLLLTGARLGAVANYKAEFNKGAYLEFPEELQGVKGSPFIVMGTQAQECLKKIKPGVPAYTVSNCLDNITVKAGINPPHHKLTNKQRREKKAAIAEGIWLEPQKQAPQQRYSPHALRKTFATTGARIKETSANIQALLSHSLGYIEDIYIIQEAEALLPVSQRVADKLMEIMGITTI